MPSMSLKPLLVAALLGLAGCAAQTPPVEVTRFHLDQPIAPGRLAIEPRDPVAAKSLEFGVYAKAVEAEFGRLGFTPASGVAGSELVAVVDILSTSQEGPPKPPRFSIGFGGASFGRHVGVGGGVQVPVDKPRPGDEFVTTMLSVQLKRRSDGTVIWEGRARGQARLGTPLGSSEAMAKRLAAALFKGFPGDSGRTIAVP